MLTEVEVRTSQGALLNMPIQDVSSGVVVEAVEGLDPVKATIVSSSFSSLDGAQYHSSRREARNIKFRLGLEPDYTVDTVRDLRMRLYNFFMPKSPVDLAFIMADGLTVNISGRVESFETALFSSEPAVDISIICFDPDFYDLTAVQVGGMTTPDLVETTIIYPGSVETGIKLTLNVDRAISEFTVYSAPPDGTLRTLDFAAPLIAGDVLTISTVPGDKEALLTRAGSISSILYGISPQSSWIELLPGSNKIRVYAEGVGVPYTIEYTNKYGGL